MSSLHDGIPSRSWLKRVFRRRGLLQGIRCRGRRGFNPEQFHVEDQSGVGSDQVARAAVAVGKIGRDEQTPLGTHRHQLQAFGPAWDYIAQRESGWLAAFLGAI